MFSRFDMTPRSPGALWARLAALALALGLPVAPTAQAASAGPAAPSPMAGNGHNVTFDGRIFIARQGGPQDGWNAFVFRPQNVRYAPGGALNLQQGAFSAPVLIQPTTSGENALAICEADANNTPFACDESGAPAAGPYACYDLYIIDSNAEGNQFNGLRRRRLKLWVSAPGTPEATVAKSVWTEAMAPVMGGGKQLRGIEPTVTRDGRLMVWQGHPNNDGKIDILMYATNAEPCGTVWSAHHNLSHLVNDPAVKGVYPIADKGLRAADGAAFSDGDMVRGAYPWLFPDGDALTFTSVVIPCITDENPPGCGPRRGGLAIMGYPTNWTLAHIDGSLNPATDDIVRLFFSSPGATTFPQLPVTSGVDVWPFFGSNTANHGDIVLDDGLDGQYAGVWLMNESVNKLGDLDKSKTPDTSGYFNTGVVNGATFPANNDGLFGKALHFDGVNDWVQVAHSSPLSPVNALTVSMWLRPDAPVDCDGNNNYRFLAGKGNIGDGAWSLVMEEGEVFQARVRVGGEQRSVWSVGTPIPVGAWSEVGFTYEAATGAMRFYVNGTLAGSTEHPPGPLDATNHAITIGGPGGARPACPNGDGSFMGAIDELRVSRVVRDLSIAARPGNHSRFVSAVVPESVSTSQPFTASYTFRNVGRTAWAPATMHRLGSQAPQDNGTWGTGRLELPAGRVETGESVTITAPLVAPATPGIYELQWRLVHEGAEWFGESTAVALVNVVAGCGPCDDGNACTTDTCDAGTCVNVLAVSCDDAEPCTDRSCDVATGACLSTLPAAVPAACDDGDPCTTDACDPVALVCTHAAIGGCGDAPDAGPVDAGQVDAGPVDAGPVLEPDARVIEIAEDVGMQDSDADAPDAAGSVDARGSTSDDVVSPGPDAGGVTVPEPEVPFEEGDATSLPPSRVRPVKDGGGCTTGTSPPASLFAIGIALGLMALRRRSRR